MNYCHRYLIFFKVVFDVCLRTLNIVLQVLLMSFRLNPYILSKTNCQINLHNKYKENKYNKRQEGVETIFKKCGCGMLPYIGCTVHTETISFLIFNF